MYCPFFTCDMVKQYSTPFHSYNANLESSMSSEPKVRYDLYAVLQKDIVAKILNNRTLEHPLLDRGQSPLQL